VERQPILKTWALSIIPFVLTFCQSAICEPLQGIVSDGIEAPYRLTRPALSGNAQVMAQPSVQEESQLNQQMPQYDSNALIGNVNQFELNQVYTGAPNIQPQFDEHGQRIVGVIGCQVEGRTGFVINVFPPSALNQWGIHRGDRILGYNNHRFRSGADMVREGCMGPPGSIMEITVLHNGRMVSLPCPRVDSRALIGYDRFCGIFNNHYRNCAAQTKTW
jgi:hypothetical protein